MNYLKKFKQLILLVSVFVVCYSFVFYISAAWTDAPGTPTYCPSGSPGCDAPINAGPTAQTKTGSFRTNGELTVIGTSYLANVNVYGNVGIGTVAPGSLLEVKSASGNGAVLTLNHPGTADYGQISFQENGVAKGFINHMGTTRAPTERQNNLEIGTIGTNAIQFRPNDAAAMTIINGGNVGIGTASPSYKLDVQGGQVNASAGLCIAGVCKTDWSQASGPWTVSGSNIYNNNSGNIGIGTVAPGAKLHISNGDNSVAYFGPNSSWGAYLYVGSGTNKAAAGTAQVISTNGNLHLDSGSGNDMYLNYYSSGRPIHAYGSVDITNSLSVAGGTVTGETTSGHYYFKGTGGDSGQANAYYGIYQESGPWTNPYPDLRIQYHTGIKYDAYYGYGGHRFYTGYDGTGNPYGLTFSVGDGDQNVRVVNNLYVGNNVNATKYCDQNGNNCKTIPDLISGSSLWSASGNNISNTNSGNVGIGMTGPGAKLDVGTGTGDVIRSYGGFTGNAAANIGGTGAAAYFPNGLWSNGANSWIYGTIYTNGAIYDTGSRWSINPAGNSWFNGGNVGIGTTAPTSKTDIVGGLRLRQTSDPSSASLIELGNRNAAWGYGINFNAYYDGIWKYRSTDYAGGFGFTSAGDFVFSLTPSGTAEGTLPAGEKVRITNTGNVGIGTAVPSYKLDVQGGQVNASAGLCIAGVCKTDWSQASGPWTVSGSNIYNSNTGNVGIGTASPTSKLEVTGGQIKANGELTVVGTSYLANVRSYGNLIVDGNVGIGTTAPSTKLEVVGGPIKATGGLILETRNNDPAVVDGQIWVCADAPNYDCTH